MSRAGSRVEEQKQKLLVVTGPDAVGRVDTMMIHSRNARTAAAAVVRSVCRTSRPEDIAVRGARGKEGRRGGQKVT